jgi:hypothetical protein
LHRARTLRFFRLRKQRRDHSRGHAVAADPRPLHDPRADADARRRAHADTGAILDAHGTAGCVADADPDTQADPDSVAEAHPVAETDPHAFAGRLAQFGRLRHADAGTVMPAVRRSARALSVVLAFGTGCSSSSSPGVAPTPPGVCPAIAIAAPQLAYPIPGATGVPTAPGDLVFYGSLPGTFAGTLRSSTSGTLALGPFGAAPSPLPSPLATPDTDSGSVSPRPLAGVPYPQLAAGTTYTISFTMSGSCPMTVSEPAYTFTTR